jgi:RNA-directed DNA polymerase
MQLAFPWEAGVKPRGPGARVDAFPARQLTEHPLYSETLREEVVERGTMQAALRQVRANQGSPGGDGMCVDALAGLLKTPWLAITDQRLKGTYQPQVITRVELPKAGSQEKRQLGLPGVIARLLQQALLPALQWRWEPTFAMCSYGVRPGRAAHQAVAQVQASMAQGYS